jgi:Skp family chaperone for outer membrane proteins
VKHLFLAFFLATIASSSAATNDHAGTRLKEVSSGARSAADESDPIEKEFKKLLEMDDAAQDEADKMISDAKAADLQSTGVPSATLNARLDQHFTRLKKAYEKAHPRA